MSQISALISGPNQNYDYQLTALARSIVNPGVISGLLVSSGSVDIGEAFILCTRTNGQQIMVHYTNTASVAITTSGTTKVWVGISQSVIDDGSTNAVDGTGIATIQSGASYPVTGAYIPLASIISGSITDTRVSVTGKPILKSGFPINKAVYIEPSTGNQVLKDTEQVSSFNDTDVIIARKSDGTESRGLFSGIKSQLGSAGKLTQNVTFAESIPSGAPTAVAIRTSFTRNDFVPLLTTNSGNPDFLVSQSATWSDPTYNGVNVFDKNATTGWYTNSAGSHWVKINFSQRRCITSLKIQAKGTVFEPNGWKLQGSNDDSTYTDVYTSASSTTTSLVTHSFTNTNFYKYYRLLFPSHPAQGEIVTVEFSESFVAPYTLSAYKTQAYELSEVCQFAGFVQGPKSIGDTETITCGNGTPVGGFSGLSILSKYYLSNTPGLISTTAGTVSRLVGYTLYDPTTLIIDNGNLLPGTNITR